jgi:ApbE superfamily uncharacterized protein (UPF0280 family)
MKASILIEEPRSYRTFDTQDDFKSFRVTVETSDLYVKALSDLSSETEALVRECRALIERSIEQRAEFLTSYSPIEILSDESVVSARMIRAGQKAGVGPMASVAGAVAEYVGRGLMNLSDEVMIENGGDLFIFVKRNVVIGIYAGMSPFSEKIGLKIEPTVIPLGISTSSGLVGPSKSFGRANAATVLSHDPTLADAVATALGNRVKKFGDLGPACEWAMSIDGVMGCLAILEDKMAALGAVELVPVC